MRPVTGSARRHRPTLGPQARETVDRLLRAGAACFAASGFHESSVEHIVRAAGVARGTFYKYFDDKADMLTTLAERCADETERLNRQFAGLGPGPDFGPALRARLVDLLEHRDRYAGIARAFSADPDDPLTSAARHRTLLSTRQTYAEVFSRFDRPVALDENATYVIVLGLLERLPEQGAGTPYEQDRNALVETIARILERGPFASPAPTCP